MTHLARLRPRLTKLSLPIIWLASVSALVSFFTLKQLADWQLYLLWSIAFVALLLLWFLPSMKYAATFVDVKSTGLVISRGFGSSRRIELAWSEISNITASALRGIVISTKENDELVLRGYSNQKAIVLQINALIAGKIAV